MHPPTKSVIPPLRPAYLLVAVLSTLATACGPSAAFVRATEAESEGDWHTAVVSYRTALAEDPDEEQLRLRLAFAEQQLVAVTASRVSQRVASQDFEGALATIGPELALLPHDPTLLATLESIRLGGLRHSRQLHADGKYREAYQEAMILQRSFPRDSEIIALRQRARTDFARQIRTRALRAESEGRLGMALASWAVHYTLFDDDESRFHGTELRAALEAEIAFRYHVAFDGLLAQLPIPLFGQNMVASPTSSRDDAHLAIWAEMSQPEAEEFYSVSIAYQRYLAGYEEVANPSYDHALWRVEQAERDVLYAEREVLEAERDVHRAEADLNQHRHMDDYDSYLQRWDSAMRELQNEREQLQDQRERLQHARERLRDTPPTWTQEVWDDFPYEVRDHTRSLEALLQLRIQPLGLDQRVLTETLTAFTTDRAHDGFPHVGLAHDPLQYPYNDRDLTAHLQNQALQQVSNILAEGFSSYRQRFREDGSALVHSDPNGAVEQLVRYILLDPNACHPDAVDRLDRLADLWSCELLDPIP